MCPSLHTPSTPSVSRAAPAVVEPEAKLKLLERGAEVKMRYRRRRIATAERSGSYMLTRCEDSGADKLHMDNFARRRRALKRLYTQLGKHPSLVMQTRPTELPYLKFVL